jgi:hypothetical protein
MKQLKHWFWRLGLLLIDPLTWLKHFFVMLNLKEEAPDSTVAATRLQYCRTGDLFFSRRTCVMHMKKKKKSVCLMPKHKTKTSLVSRVLQCKCVWMEHNFGDFFQPHSAMTFNWEINYAGALVSKHCDGLGIVCHIVVFERMHDGHMHAYGLEHKQTTQK